MPITDSKPLTFQPKTSSDVLAKFWSGSTSSLGRSAMTSETTQSSKSDPLLSQNLKFPLVSSRPNIDAKTITVSEKSEEDLTERDIEWINDTKNVGSAFSTKNLLKPRSKIITKKLSTDKGPFVCQHCGESFQLAQSLGGHTSKAHRNKSSKY